MKIVARVLAALTLATWAYQASAIPISAADTVTVGAREWAQVDLFANLSWSDINTACSAGTCGAGTLNSYDMAGWTWATTDDVNALFNYYLEAAGVVGAALLGPGPDYYEEQDSSWAPAFFADGLLLAPYSHRVVS